jgi:hypothetical protein
MDGRAFTATAFGPRLLAPAATATATGSAREPRRLLVARWRHEAELARLAPRVLATDPQLTLRLATLADAGALARLADLDSARLPDGALLVAEVDGQLLAALSLGGGSLVADPFVPTAQLAPLLRARAAQLAAVSAAGTPVSAAEGRGGLTPACC